MSTVETCVPRDAGTVRDDERAPERIARVLYEHVEALAPKYGEARSGVAWQDLSVQRRALLVHAVGAVLAERLIRLPEAE